MLRSSFVLNSCSVGLSQMSQLAPYTCAQTHKRLLDGVTWACNEINKQSLAWSGFTVHWQGPWYADWNQHQCAALTWLWVMTVMSARLNSRVCVCVCVCVCVWMIQHHPAQESISLERTHACMHARTQTMHTQAALPNSFGKLVVLSG